MQGFEGKRLPICGTLVWATEYIPLSTVFVRCGDDEAEETRDEFLEIFGRKWKEAEERTAAEIGVPIGKKGYYPTIEDVENPLDRADVVDGGFVVRFNPLLIPYCWGDFCEIQQACGAVEEAFSELREKREAPYGGLIAFPWSDRRCGDFEEYEIGAGGVKRSEYMPFVWEAVEEALEDRDEFEERLTEEVSGIDEDELEELLSEIEKAASKEQLASDAAATIASILMDAEYDEEVKPKNFERMRRLSAGDL